MVSSATAKYSALCENGTVDFDAQPRRPENLALINVSGNLSGSISVSEGGIDFSTLTLAVAKSAILSESSEYKAVAALVSENEIIYIDAFDSATYAHTAMTFTGKAVALPKTESVGDYKLILFFAKIVDDEAIRLSDIATPAVNDFASFTVNADGEDGYYTYSFSKNDGIFSFVSEFTDTAAPEIILSEIIGRTEGENPTYTLTVGEGAATVADLVSLVSATDSRDGSITVTTLNVKLESSSEELFADYGLIPDSAYVITVCDMAGNESSVTVNIVSIPSIPSDGETNSSTEGSLEE